MAETIEDDRYLAAKQEDGNFVVYIKANMQPVWDRFSYEALSGPPPQSQPQPQPSPAPDMPVPEIPSGPVHVKNLIKVSDGPFHPRFYSYWSNAFVRGSDIFVFAGGMDNTPRFFEIEHGRVRELGPLVRFRGTTEGWYWNAAGWLYIPDGPRLMLVNPFTGEEREVWNIEHAFPGTRLWQTHSGDDGQTHCGTVQSTSSWQKMGSAAWRNGRLIFIPARGSLDECAITTSGRDLIIKEDNDNLIINLDDNTERRLTQVEGAVGHSDCGTNFVVGEDDQHGACVLWDLRRPLTPDNRKELFHTWNMGHVSVRGHRCLLSNSEIIGMVDLQHGGIQGLVNHGSSGGGYDQQVRANLSPCGRCACYMANGAVYVLEL